MKNAQELIAAFHVVESTISKMDKYVADDSASMMINLYNEQVDMYNHIHNEMEELATSLYTTILSLQEQGRYSLTTPLKEDMDALLAITTA